MKVLGALVCCGWAIFCLIIAGLCGLIITLAATGNL